MPEALGDAPILGGLTRVPEGAVLMLNSGGLFLPHEAPADEPAAKAAPKSARKWRRKKEGEA